MTKATNMSSDNEIDELGALLADLPLDGETVIYEGSEEDKSIEDLRDILEVAPEETVDEGSVEAVSEEQPAPVITPTDTVDDDALRDLEFAIDKHAAYAEQTAIKTDDPSAVEEKKKAGSTRARSATTAAPRTPRDLASVADEFFVLEGTVAAVTDLAANRAATEALRPAQKKIAEKFDNLFTAISVSKEPSRYVVIAYKLLADKGSFTSADLIAAYRTPGARTATEGYDEGTARSQCGQIMNLFDTVKIAKRSGNTLTANPDSTLAKRLDAILAP